MDTLSAIGLFILVILIGAAGIYVMTPENN